MISPHLTTLFTTLAQVTFTVAGLLALAIAGDAGRRNYWFGNDARKLFVYSIFLILLLPGFISIGSLIPPYSDDSIPTWPYSAFFFGAIYFVLAITLYFRKKRLTDPLEFKRLEKNYSRVDFLLAIFGFGLIITAISGLSSYYSSIVIYNQKDEIYLGLILVGAVAIGTLASVNFLHSGEHPKTTIEREASTNQNFMELTANKKESTQLFTFIAILLTLLVFCVGIMLGDRARRS